MTDQDSPSFRHAVEQARESWQGGGQPARPSPFEIMAARIKLERYKFQDPKTIPPREWLYGTHLARRYVSARIAPSGLGKSSVNMVDLLAMTSGLPLLGRKPPEPLNVFYWGEDPRDEIERRFEACRQYYGLRPEDITGFISLNSARDMEIKTAVARRDGIQIVGPVHEALVREFKITKIDVAMIDPFVSSHGVSENDNVQIDTVAKQWQLLADQCNCAIDLTHHLRKAAGGQERTVEDGRGAVSFNAAARDVELLVKMTKEEAAALGIGEAEMWRYFRIGDSLANMAPPASKSEWFALASVDLDNAKDGRPSDKVGVVTKWTPPALFEGVSTLLIDRAFRAIETGKWRRDGQADEWIGHPLSAALGLDLDKAKTRLKGMIDAWIKSGALEVYEALDEKRHKKKFVRLGNWEFTTPAEMGET